MTGPRIHQGLAPFKDKTELNQIGLPQDPAPGITTPDTSPTPPHHGSKSFKFPDGLAPLLEWDTTLKFNHPPGYYLGNQKIPTEKKDFGSYQNSLNKAKDVAKGAGHRALPSGSGINILPLPNRSFGNIGFELDLHLEAMEELVKDTPEARKLHEKNKEDIYQAAYDSVRARALQLIKNEADEKRIAHALEGMKHFGGKIGKTDADHAADVKFLYQEKFFEVVGEATELAKKRHDGDAFDNRMKELNQYGKLAGLNEHQIKTFRREIFEELYLASINEIKEDCNDGSCLKPQKEIKYTGSRLTVKGYDMPWLIHYGKLAGKTLDEIGRDIDKVKEDVRVSNEIRIKNYLLGGAKEVIGAPTRAVARVVDSIQDAGQKWDKEIRQGFSQLGEGIETFVESYIL